MDKLYTAVWCRCSAISTFSRSIKRVKCIWVLCILQTPETSRKQWGFFWEVLWLEFWSYWKCHLPTSSSYLYT